jgi:hypothetical protein
MRTTINLRRDIYDILVRRAGTKRRLSEEVNKALAEHLIKEKKLKLFGSCPELEEFVREEDDLDRFD